MMATTVVIKGKTYRVISTGPLDPDGTALVTLMNTHTYQRTVKRLEVTW